VHNSNLQNILNIFSNARYIELLKVIAKGNRTPDFIRKKLNVTKKDMNAMMGRLVPLGIIDMINDQYELTRLGKEIFESLMMIENATKIYCRLGSAGVLEEGREEEEIVKLIDRMEFNKRLKQLIIQTITKKHLSNE
jgi:predicted transcriptional regulator